MQNPRLELRLFYGQKSGEFLRKPRRIQNQPITLNDHLARGRGATDLVSNGPFRPPGLSSFCNSSVGTTAGVQGTRIGIAK